MCFYNELALGHRCRRLRLVREIKSNAQLNVRFDVHENKYVFVRTLRRYDFKTIITITAIRGAFHRFSIIVFIFILVYTVSVNLNKLKPTRQQ